MSSGDQGKTKQEGLENYEKDYLERLQKQKDGQDLQNLIYNLSKDFKKPEEATKDYVGLCTFCMIGVPREEMAYKNSQLFHSNCFEQQGKNFPAPNQELLKESSNAKVQLVILKNLKFRTGDDSSPSSPQPSPSSPQPRPQPKKKSKPKAKKRRPKRQTAKKRKKTKRRTAKRKPAKRRRAKAKRRKTVRRKKIVRRKVRRRPARTRRRSPKKRRLRRRR